MNHVAATLYAKAPVWAQNLLLTGYGAILERQRYGGRYAEYRDALTASQWRSRGDIEAYQDERLRVLVAHAYEHVPYYRRVFEERKLSPADIRTSLDLPKLPVLTKADIRRSFAELRSRAVAGRRFRTGHTSGTTGTPLTVGYDLDTVWMTYAVFDRHYEWAGASLAHRPDRIAVARGNVIVPLAQKAAPYWRLNRPQNQLMLSSFHLSQENLPAYFDAMRRFEATVVDGYPSTLYVLAKYLQNRGEHFPVKAAITSSETLYEFQRSVIEERFKCRVFDYYAAAERVVFSGECDHHRGHHVSMEYGIAEVVDDDGQPCSRGTTGRLVGTSLHNLGMPLIRYASSDLSALKPEMCSCGRGLELMADVTTKAEDVLTLPDGRLISPSVLTHPFKPLDCIDGSQIVQTAPDLVEVRIVPGHDYTPAHELQLISDLQHRLGQGVRIKVRKVEALEVSKNGKFKWVISYVPLGI